MSTCGPGIQRDLYVTQLASSGNAVDRHVGRAEGRPHVVGVGAEAGSSSLRLLEELLGFRSGRSHGPGEQQRPVDGQVRRCRFAEARLQEAGRIPDELRGRAGVDLVEVARRAGHSIAVLWKFYAKILRGQEHRANQLIDDALGVSEESATTE
ncbi:hypothetical protein [Streptomyces kronopolitis]|uniref:hypothetical protein n=1 Tax=Streptomyces kronopolitis TaxID=1612435 RepID=UPI003686DF68